MKTFLVMSVLVGLTLPVSATEMERTVTEKTTTYRGTVSQFDPGSSTIVLQSESGGPRSYSITEKTTFVDEAGNVVSRETIRNQPVTVTYAQEGDRMIASKVIVTRPAGGVIERRERTEEHRIE